MDKENIITPDKILELANNYISRYKTDIVLSPDRNIFFVKPDFLHDFIRNILPKINYKFILLTHDSDIPVTEEYRIILDNPYLIKWFGMNCHILHDKLQPIPIGMANEVWPHGNKDTMIKVIKENNIKSNLVYCNFDPNTNLSARSYSLSILKSLPFIDFESVKLDYETYLRKLSSYKYVISPPGNSVDCHRIWEAVWLGVIPICLKSIPLVAFKDLPILFINDWTDITQDLLITKYDTIITKTTEKADFNFYKKDILSVANQI